MQLNLHNVEHVEIEAPQLLGSTERYSRTIVVHTARGRARIVLFADTAEALAVAPADEC